MKLFLSVLGSCLVVILTVIFLLEYVSDPPSTEQLNADIAAVSAQISEVEAEQSRYTGGAILQMLAVNLGVLKTTQSMLELKRSSIVRRVDLQYVVDGQVHVPREDVITALEQDLVAARTERERFKLEADRYVGGLIQTVALMNVATSDMSIAQLQLKLLGEKYGFALGGANAAPVGQEVVDEGEAL